MKYNPDLFSKGVFPRFTGVTVYENPSYSSDVLYTVNGFVGMTDGMYENVDGWTWYRLAAIDGTHVWGWVREDYVDLKTVSPVEYNTAQARLNLIIENDMNSLTYLLVSSEYCRRLEAKGYDVSAQKEKIRELYASIVERNDAIKKSGAVDDIQEGQSTLTEFAPALLAIVNNTAFVGIVLSTTALITIIISALLIGVAADYFYHSNQARLEKSTYTFKACKSLADLLSKVDKQTAQEILADIDRQIKEAEAQGYKNGYFKATFGVSWLSVLKWGAIGVGALYLVKWLKNNF